MELYATAEQVNKKKQARGLRKLRERERGGGGGGGGGEVE